jgi:hypothetical protein
MGTQRRNRGPSRRTQMRAKTTAACTALSRSFILITAPCDQEALDHGDRPTSEEVASRRSARGCAATLDHR